MSNRQFLIRNNMKEYRCKWAEGHELSKKYHDREWGVPCKNDARWFEYLVLDAAQAGLSWLTILKKRDGYKKVFDNFDYKKLAKWSDVKLERALKDESIVRNRLKVYSVRKNARAFLEVQKEFGSFNKYIWSFSKNKIVDGKIKSMKNVPAKTELSDTISKDLKKRGFTFVGSTIIYAFLQAGGVVNDHEMKCFRYLKLKK